MCEEITLMDYEDEQGSRFMSVRQEKDGTLVFTGQDLGKAVQDLFHVSEYEYGYVVEAKEIPKLKKALGCKGDLLDCIKEKFSGNPPDVSMYNWLTKNKIKCELWSRVGD